MNQPNSSSPPTVLQPAPPTASQGHGGVSRGFVSVAIAVVAVTFVSLLAIIYVKSWLNRPAVPNAILVVQANPQFDGMTVSVRSDGSLVQPPQTIGAAGNYSCVFHIAPGEYRVHMELGGRWNERDVTLLAGRILSLTPQKGGATTRKAGAEMAKSGS